MNGSERTIANSMAVAWSEQPRSQRLRVAGSLCYVAALSLLFIEPLIRLLAHASQNSLHSHIPLIPLISAYLIYVQPPRVQALRTSFVGALIVGAIGGTALAVAAMSSARVSTNDHLAVLMLAYVSFIAAGGFLFLGPRWMAGAAFPIAFLIFMIPLPDAATAWTEMALVQASADVSAALFRLTGTPLLRDGNTFVLPGIVLEVARECSGIRSTWVLFITSIIASHLFLRSTWRRIVLVAFVIPLGIVRNAIRILTIGLLCVYVDPLMIDSVIHHRGGPIFFVLSLVPLFLLMWWLWRQERRFV
jgi:exosortase C (VPDSG-CTERM-specific)